MPASILYSPTIMAAAPATTLRPVPTILPPSPKILEKKNVETRTPKDIFVCDEESHFYSQCLEKLVLNKCKGRQTVIEFGAGDGGPVLASLSGSGFQGVVHGFEINERAASIARKRTADYGLHTCYQVHNSCFFTAARNTDATFLVANPPYIPAPDSNIMMPALHGGTDGANLTRDLLMLGIPNVMMLFSSYSNPVETLKHAQRQGYKALDFMVTAMPFGTYSSEPKVRTWIAQMKAKSQAFYSDNCYLLAGVLLSKTQPDQFATDQPTHDLTEQVLSVLTALH